MKFIDPSFTELYNTLKNNKRLEKFFINQHILNSIDDYYENYGYNNQKYKAEKVVNDANKIVLFCDSSGITSDLENVESMEYYLIENASMEELALHGINSIGIANEVEKSGQRHELAVPAIFMVILFVMFTVAFFGEQFLSLVEREKLFAVQFMCGATRQKTFVIQMCYDIIWLLIPFVIAIAAALIIGIRLHLLGVILPFAYLLIGFLITTGISLSVTALTICANAAAGI